MQLKRMFSTDSFKGTRNYLHTQKRYEILRTVLYFIISLSPYPALGLVGCGICGFSVGIMWPGCFSLASASMPRGGTALFALLALGGDVGCSGGPTYVGMISSAFDNDLHIGILCAIIFPILLLLGLAMQRQEKVK